VVATRVGAASEVVRDGVTGRLVDVERPDQAAAAIEEVLAHGVEMGRAARREAEARFVLQVVMPRWADLLRSVARPRRSAARR
jgi:glycosyltransferase involved in cell wall biosynthesis